MDNQTLAKNLKDILDVLEKCRQLRTQLKQRLTRETLTDAQEFEMAEELYHLNMTIGQIEQERKSLLGFTAAAQKKAIV